MSFDSFLSGSSAAIAYTVNPETRVNIRKIVLVVSILLSITDVWKIK